MAICTHLGIDIDGRCFKCKEQVRADARLPPLFIALRREHFEAFRNGTKRTEYRAYGPRWNERTCMYGRKVTLSLGYGKSQRLRAQVIGFRKLTREPGRSRIYPRGTRIAAIALHVFLPAQ